MATALVRDTWEYTTFTYQTWQPDELWCSLESSEKFTIPQARLLFWEKAAGRINAEMERLIRDGWQPAETVGPDAIKVRKSERIDFRVDIPDIFFWFITLGIGLILHLFLNTPRRYITYQPIEFRLRLQRPIAQHQSTRIAA